MTETDSLPDGLDDSTGQVGVQSVETGMRLLMAMASLADDASPPRLKAIAAAAGLPPAKAHRYLVSFTRTGMVERDAVTGRYRLGPNARLIGVAAIRGSDVVRTASRRLRKLSEDAQYSAALTIWTEYGPTVIWVEEVRRPITVSTRVGEVLPLMNSASGRVFGAWLPRFQTQAVLSRELAANRRSDPDGPYTRAEAGERLFEEVRAAGIGWTRGGLTESIHSVAAPIFDYRGALVGSLALMGAADSFDTTADGRPAQLVREAAADVSEGLGYLNLRD